MRRMIPQNQQEALRKLTSKEALLNSIILGADAGIDIMTITIDTDGYTYVSISGNAILTEGDGTEMFELRNIPVGMRSAGDYVATNSNGGGGSVNVTIAGTTATFTFNAGKVNRIVYFSVLLSKQIAEL